MTHVPSETSEVSQGPVETPWERIRRMPNVLRAYAADINKYGKPLDSGLYGVLRFTAQFIDEYLHEGDKAESDQAHPDLLLGAPASIGTHVPDGWQNLPKQYVGRWAYDYDEKHSVFFVHCNGHRILDTEDIEVADAICQVHNNSPIAPASRERDARDVGHPHLIGGEFQSDKYPTCPRGKVPLSTKDKTAQDLLWEYAQRRHAIDAEFSADLEIALKAHGFEPPQSPSLAEAIIRNLTAIILLAFLGCFTPCTARASVDFQRFPAWERIELPFGIFRDIAIFSVMQMRESDVGNAAVKCDGVRSCPDGGPLSIFRCTFPEIGWCGYCFAAFAIREDSRSVYVRFHTVARIQNAPWKIFRDFSRSHLGKVWGERSVNRDLGGWVFANVDYFDFERHPIPFDFRSGPHWRKPSPISLDSGSTRIANHFVGIPSQPASEGSGTHGSKAEQDVQNEACPFETIVTPFVLAGLCFVGGVGCAYPASRYSGWFGLAGCIIAPCSLVFAAIGGWNLGCHLDPPDRLSEDIRVHAVIVPPREFGNVKREILPADLVEGSHDAALEDAPEALNRVSMDGTDNIVFGLMPNGMMWVIFGQVPIRGMFVGGKQGTLVGDDFADEPLESFGSRILDHAGNHIAATLRSADHYELVGHLATAETAFLIPMTVFVLPANVGFVNFDHADQFAKLRVRQGDTDAVRHVERRFVRAETHGPVNLVRGNAFLAGQHDVDHAKPVAQTDVRVLENGSDQHREPIAVRAAFLTLPMEGARPQLIAVRRAATRAIDAFRKAVMREISLASVIVRESLFPLSYGHLVNAFAGAHVPFSRSGEEYDTQ